MPLPNYWNKKYMDKVGLPTEPIPGAPPGKSRKKTPPPTIISPPGSGNPPAPPTYHLESYGASPRRPMFKEGVPAETAGTTGKTSSSVTSTPHPAGSPSVGDSASRGTGAAPSSGGEAGGGQGGTDQNNYVVVHNVAVPKTLNLPTRFIFRPVPSSFRWGGYLIAYDPRTYRVQIIKNGRVIAQYKYDPASKKFVIDETWLFFAKKEDQASEARDVVVLERQLFKAPKTPVQSPKGEYYEKKRQQEMLVLERMTFTKPKYGEIQYKVEEVPVDVGFYAVDRQRKYEAWLELEKIAKKYGFNFSPVPFAYEEPLLDVGLYAVGRAHAYEEWERKRKHPFKDGDFWGLGKVLNWLEEKAVSAEDWLGAHFGTATRYLELPAKGVSVLGEKMRNNMFARYATMLTPLGQSMFVGSMIMESAAYRPSSLKEFRDVARESFENASDFTLGVSVGIMGTIASMPNPKAWISIFRPTSYKAMYEEAVSGGPFGLGEVTGSLALAMLGLKGVKIPRKTALDLARLEEFDFVYRNFEARETSRVFYTKEGMLVENPGVGLASKDYLAVLKGEGELKIKPSGKAGFSLEPGRPFGMIWFELRNNYLYRNALKLRLAKEEKPWWKRLVPSKERYKLNIEYYGDYGPIRVKELLKARNEKDLLAEKVVDFEYLPEKFFRFEEELEFSLGFKEKTKVLLKKEAKTKMTTRMKSRDPIVEVAESVEKTIENNDRLVFSERYVPSIPIPINIRVPMPLNASLQGSGSWNQKPSVEPRPKSEIEQKTREKLGLRERSKERIKIDVKNRTLMKGSFGESEYEYMIEKPRLRGFDINIDLLLGKPRLDQILKIPLIPSLEPPPEPPSTPPPDINVSFTAPFGFDFGSKYKRGVMRKSRRKKVERWEIVFPERLVELWGVMV